MISEFRMQEKEKLMCQKAWESWKENTVQVRFHTANHGHGDRIWERWRKKELSHPANEIEKTACRSPDIALCRLNVLYRSSIPTP